MRFAYADPPYPGQSAKHYSDHGDYAGEVGHYDLIKHLREYDGWLLHTSAPALQYVLGLLAEQDQLTMQGDGWQKCDGCGGADTFSRPSERYSPGGLRIFAWTKPFAAFKRNVSPAYAWEPVIVKPLRKGEPNQRPDSPVMRDWLAVRTEDCSQEEMDAIAESITLRKGLTGAKPERLCRWLFEACGLRPEDQLDDLFPGSGAVTAAWESWRSAPQLETEPPREDAALTAGPEGVAEK